MFLWGFFFLAAVKSLEAKLNTFALKSQHLDVLQSPMGNSCKLQVLNKMLLKMIWNVQSLLLAREILIVSKNLESMKDLQWKW